jgi:hypothetical protein
MSKFELGLAVASDLYTFFDVAGFCSIHIETIKNIGLQYFNSKKAEANEILLNEFGGIPPQNIDADFVVNYYHYHRAAQEGAARENLRLMARIIAGQPSYKSLKINDFVSYANIISQLSYEEIQLLGVFYKHWKINKPTDNVANATYNRSAKELIPQIFSDKEELNSEIRSLIRTGFINFIETGVPVFKFTKKGEKIAELAKFELITNRHC